MDYGRQAVEFATPYVENAAGRVERGYQKSKRKLKRNMRLHQLNRILGFVGNVLTIVTSLMALFLLISRILDWFEE